MHPGFLRYWTQRQRYGGSCGPTYSSAWCETGTQASGPEWTFHGSSRRISDPIFGSGAFGIRRPVRFLAERLDLTEKQLSQLARIVERIRIEREQAAVDLRRAAAQFADALEGSDFAADAAEAAGRRRVDAAKSVQEVVDRSLRELHALLDADQRDELASLIRTGAIKL